MCKLPGRFNFGWIFSGCGEVSCEDPDDPCATCHCHVGLPPRLSIDSQGCKKPKPCGKPCPSSTEEHRVGDNWQCWIDDLKYNVYFQQNIIFIINRCYGQCSCRAGSNGATHMSLSYGWGCGPMPLHSQTTCRILKRSGWISG